MRQVSFFLLFTTALGLFPSFKLLNATKQDYHGGIPSAGYGTKYQITLIAKTDYTHLSFDRIWVDNTELEIQVRGKNNMALSQFSKGDTLILYTVKHTNTDRTGKPLPEQKWEKTGIPIDFKGEAVIRYYLNTKERYLKIDKLDILPAENRP